MDGAKAASSILQQDQRNVGALFLRGFCLYHKNNIERALTHFQQVKIGLLKFFCYMNFVCRFFSCPKIMKEQRHFLTKLNYLKKKKILL